VTYPGTYWSIGAEDMVLYNHDFLAHDEYAPVRTFQLAHGVPVMIGEFGLQFPQNGGEQYLADIADIACGYGWHFALWNWNNTATFNYRHFDDTYGTDYMTTVESMLTDPCLTGIGNDRNPGGGPMLPEAIRLHQNRPNPFNPSTTITFDVPDNLSPGQHCSLVVFDLRGRLVQTLVDANLKAGRHRVVWHGRDNRGRTVPSGVYLYSLRSGGDRLIRKMVVRK